MSHLNPNFWPSKHMFLVPLSEHQHQTTSRNLIYVVGQINISHFSPFCRKEKINKEITGPSKTKKQGLNQH